MRIALTIAGSDPSGGAGLQADLKVFKSFGVYGLSVPSVLTAQSTTGVTDIYEISPSFFSLQIDTILKDILPNALKTGMLYSPEMVRIAAEKVKEHSLTNLVIDPVTVSSTGFSLVQDKTLNALSDYLFPISVVITPNIYEASVFTGMKINNEDDMKDAAKRLKKFGPKAVIVTGGHLEETAIDVLWDGKEFFILKSGRAEGEYHGTGCAFSAAITACLALGFDIRESALKAKRLVEDAIKSAVSIGRGMKLLNL
ncbi:MAG: bifunctional hydroxymethylpyrimidine kinase/phosphomethylpyrimidine kinase [Nitrospirae bacterium]|nr:bifunctional hydroxymethylpyrimidine kinase/phosphomethylpyrimidine kinase [Nitrospirota bacterium]